MGGEDPKSARMAMNDSKDGDLQEQFHTHFGCFQIWKVQMTMLYRVYVPLCMNDQLVVHVGTKFGQG